MNIFDIINSLIFNRERIEYVDDTFILYLVQRWVSMYDPLLCIVLNDTINKHWSAINLPQDQYDYLYHVMWRMPYKRSSYIKKTKKGPLTADEKRDEDDMKVIARNMNISVRELKMYHDLVI